MKQNDQFFLSSVAEDSLLTLQRLYQKVYPYQPNSEWQNEVTVHINVVLNNFRHQTNTEQSVLVSAVQKRAICWAIETVVEDQPEQQEHLQNLKRMLEE